MLVLLIVVSGISSISSQIFQSEFTRKLEQMEIFDQKQIKKLS